MSESGSTTPQRRTVYVGDWSDRAGRYTSVWGCYDTRFPQMYGGEHTAMQAVEVPAGEPEGPYWAWEDAEDGAWSITQPSQMQLETCFPYGTQAEVDRGRGRVVNFVLVGGVDVGVEALQPDPRLRECRLAKNGRRVKWGPGAGSLAHPDDKAWWVVNIAVTSDGNAQHGYEVCLIHVTHSSWSPTWPILACTSRGDAREWAGKLRAFARTISAEDAHDHFEQEVNGDARLAAWLKENGFHRHNHIWWTRAQIVPRGN